MSEPNLSTTGGPTTVGPGPVLLRLPADPAMSRVLRLAASGLASLSGLTVDEIEDLKIAVSEVLVVLIEHGGGNPVDVTIEAVGKGFQIDASTEVDEFDPDDPDLGLCRTVLGGVCASHDIHVDAGRAHIRAVVGRSD